MKEAAGEANMTIITIVLIAIVLLVGTGVVVTMMNNASDKSSNVDDNNGQSCPTGYNWNSTTGHCEKQSGGV